MKAKRRSKLDGVRQAAGSSVGYSCGGSFIDSEEVRRLSEAICGWHFYGTFVRYGHFATDRCFGNGRFPILGFPEGGDISKVASRVVSSSSAACAAPSDDMSQPPSYLLCGRCGD